MTSIQSIETGENELAALPLNGSVAFFLTDHLENVENYIKVIKKNASNKPNLASYIYSQSGRIEEDYIPDFSVAYNSQTKRVEIKFLNLVPIEEYIIIINTSFSVGVVSSINSYGIGTVSAKNSWLNDTDINSMTIRAVSDSMFMTGYNSYKTTFDIILSGTVVADTITIDSSDNFIWNGININVTNEPFLQNDEFHIAFTKNVDSFNTINIKAANIEYTSDAIFKDSKRVNELDLISFYENENQSNQPQVNTTKVKRILKSMSSMIIEFEEVVDLQLANISATVMPAFNMLSLPEEDWLNAKVKINVKKISPKMILLNFSESESGIMEVIKDV